MAKTKSVVEIPSHPDFFIGLEDSQTIYRRIGDGESPSFEVFQPQHANIEVNEHLYVFDDGTDDHMSTSEIVLETFFGVADLPYHAVDSKWTTKSYAYRVGKYEQKSQNVIEFPGCKHKNVPNVFMRIPGFSGYAINENGVIFSIRRGSYVKWSFNKDGHWTVCPTGDGGEHSPVRVDRLIYSAFVEPLQCDEFVRHIDGKWYNVRLSNLEKVSRESIQEERAAKKSAEPKKETRAYVHFGANNIVNICEMLLEGKSNREIAEVLGIDYDTRGATVNTLIFNIRHHRTHPAITKQYDFSEINKTRRYTKKEEKGNAEET